MYLIRLICRNCGRSFKVQSDTPKADRVCPLCFSYVETK